jgi:hypothetical protein
MHIRQNAEVKSAVLEKGHELTVDTVKICLDLYAGQD